MEMFQVTGYGSDFYYSLDTIAQFLGLGKKESSGADVHDWYINKQYEKIALHCLQDVTLLRQIYKLI
jgi:hypothetical protein